MNVDQEQVITTLEGMTVLELNALVKQLEERWGVSAAAPMAVGVAAGAAGGAAAAAPEEEQTEFDVMLTEIGANKILVRADLSKHDVELGLLLLRCGCRRAAGCARCHSDSHWCRRAHAPPLF